jgi:hypothetical protein
MNEAAIEQARAEAARYGQQQVPEKWKKKEATTHVEQTPGKQRKPDTYIDGLPGWACLVAQSPLPLMALSMAWLWC